MFFFTYVVLVVVCPIDCCNFSLFLLLLRVYCMPELLFSHQVFKVLPL